METFPAYFPLRGKRVVIAGEGEPADAKARLFAEAPAEVVRLDEATALNETAYAGADLVFVASWDASFRRAAALVARTAGVPLNVVDEPELSDFHTPAIIDRGQVVAAVGTAGASPLMASLVRAQVEAALPEGAGAIAVLLGERRDAVRQAFPDLVHRRAFLRKALVGPAARAAAAGDLSGALAHLDEAIAAGGTAPGRICCIETPAAADLMSLRAARLLAVADTVVAGPGAEILLAHHGRRDADRLGPDNVGFEVLAGFVEAGRIVALIGVMPDESDRLRLSAKGVDIEVVSAARAS